MIVHAGQDACVVQEDERHAAYKEEDGHEGSHNDEHRRLARRYACMAQEHELRHSAARCPRRQKREEVVAEDHLHRLSQRDVLARDLHEVHEARAVKRQTKAHAEERKGDGPRLERCEIFQRMNVDRRIDDGARDEENEQQRYDETLAEHLHLTPPQSGLAQFLRSLLFAGCPRLAIHIFFVARIGAVIVNRLEILAGKREPKESGQGT